MGNGVLQKCLLAAGIMFVITGIGSWGDGLGVSVLVQGLLLCAAGLYQKPVEVPQVGDIDQQWREFNEQRNDYA